MPFRSEAQRKFLWLKHPKVAKKWSREYGSQIVKSRAKVVKGKKK